ncbi:MAG: extracellular solute-binding protein [Clostridia bacterium]|nr:extracellular solute-binding protein [Clostridia bacterium]MBQ6564242.1 extracellular solute-binding protein [Clostridia bacterium]
MKKILSIVLCLVLTLSVVSGAFAADAVEVALWTVFTGDDGVTIQNLVDQFNAENEGKIHVTHSPIDAENLYTNMYLAVQTGTEVPDVIIGHVERVPKFVADGILTDLSTLTEGAIDLANYPAHVLERTNIDGYQFGIPWDFNAPVLYVNMDLIAKYDVASVLEDGYVTFDELKVVGEAIKAADPDQTVKVTNNYGGFNEFVARYEELGQVELIQDGKLVIDPKIWGDMLLVFRDLYKSGYAVERGEDAMNAFLGGNLVFLEAGTWVNATLMQVEGLNYDAVPMTCFSPETALCRVGSHTWMQPENEERTEETDLAVATFIDWMGAHSLAWGTSAGQVPLYKAVTETEEFKALPQTFLAEAGMNEHIKIFKYYYWALFTNAVGHVGMDAIFDDSIDVYGVGEAIQKEVDDAISAS